MRLEDWDDFRQQVRRTDTNYSQINAKLREIQARFDSEVVAFSVVERTAVEHVFREFSWRGNAVELVSVQEITFWSGCETFMTTKATDRGERTIAKYHTLQTILHAFESGYRQLTFIVITHDFFHAIKTVLIKKRCLTYKTVGKYISTLKTYLSWAEDRGAIVPKDDRKYKVDEEDVEVVALTWSELERIQNIDLSNQPRRDRVLDLFLFACYIGARFGDIQKLHMDDIRVRNAHTPHTAGSGYCSPVSSRWPLPKIGSQRMNDYLRKLGRLAEITEPVQFVRYQGAKRVEDRRPKWQFLSSHVARRTFVTISLERGMRPEVVMSITGHRSFKTMKKYIALTEQYKSEAMENVWGK